MNLRRALAHLARAGITAEVLAAEHVDATDPTAVRHLVDRLIASMADADSVFDTRIERELQAARLALLTPAERDADDALLARLRRDLALYPLCTADAALAA